VPEAQQLIESLDEELAEFEREREESEAAITLSEGRLK
jgi:hypothetical protein